MPRVLLILPTSTYRAPDFLAAARVLGTEVVVASEHRQALSGSMGDRALVISLRGPEAAARAIEELHRRAPLDAVVAVDDVGQRAAAAACARIGLRCNPPKAVSASHDKAAMRRALAAAGIAQPEHRVAAAGDDVAALAAEVGLPCVVKPVSLSASQGVIRADDARAAEAAARRIRAILECAGEDAGGPLLVERYVSGAEVAVEGLLRAGRLEVLAVFDKPDPLEGPYFEETIYVTPSRLPTDALQRIERLTQATADALGLREGPVHAELRLDGDQAFVLELAARSIGGLCSRALRFGTGASLEEVILRHALGLPLLDLHREAAASGVMMLPIERGGVLTGVGGLDEALAVSGITDLQITVPPDREVVPLPEGDRYLGFIFARGDDPAAVEAALREAHARLEVDIRAPAAAAVR